MSALERFHCSKIVSNIWHTEIPGLWTQELDAGLWMLDAGFWTLEAGLWTLDSGRWTLDAGLWTLLLTVVEQNQNSVFDFV